MLMSTVQHTPGCERISNFIRSSMAPTDPNAPRGVLIAEFRDGYGLPHTDEAKANAALFIAAAGLLEALELTLQTAEENHMQLCHMDLQVMREAIAAAKAKP